MKDFDLVVAGGQGDPNIAALLQAATSMGYSVCSIVPGPRNEPALTWEPAGGPLVLNGSAIEARALFLRYDVFLDGASGQGLQDRALAWFSTLSSWAFATPALRTFNREVAQASAHKGYALARAVAHGLPVPRTAFTNSRTSVTALGPAERLIAKPAGGGMYAEALGSLMAEVAWQGDTAPSPACVQERMVYPEYRVYLVGGAPVVFETHSAQLDFRLDRACDTRHVPPDVLPEKTLSALGALASEFALDYCAFDLKTREATREICFLEVNSNPMFAGFDSVCDGALSRAILGWLCSPEGA